MDTHQSRVGRILEALVQAKGTVCTGCLCLAAGMEDVDVAESLESLGQHVYVHVQGYRCVRCGAERAVTYNLYADRPVSEPPRTSRATFQLLTTPAQDAGLCRRGVSESGSSNRARLAPNFRNREMYRPPD